MRIEVWTRYSLCMHRPIHPPILYFGTPVVLLSTLNDDHTPNLAPMSSAWALGWTVMLGLHRGGQTFANLERDGECVLNLPHDALWRAVERLAPLTGKNPVPPSKPHARFEPRKFEAADLTPQPSVRVRPPRVAECPLQLEARVRRIHPLGAPDWAAIEVEVLEVHAHPELIVDDDHVDPQRWRPLIYNFRHYFGLGPEIGRTFRARVATR